MLLHAKFPPTHIACRVCGSNLQYDEKFSFFLLVIRVLLIKLKNRRKQIQGVHDGEHKEMQQTNNLHA